VKRLLALTGVAIVLSAAPAGALTQSNTRTVNASGQVKVVNTGFKFQLGGGTLTTLSASATNITIVVVNQHNP
jgi:hypothetical protein